MIRAKFNCATINNTPPDQSERIETVSLVAVYSEDPNDINYKWSKYTPSGSMMLSISNPDAQDRFEIGKEYFIDISEVTNV